MPELTLYKHSFYVSNVINISSYLYKRQYDQSGGGPFYILSASGKNYSEENVMIEVVLSP